MTAKKLALGYAGLLCAIWLGVTRWIGIDAKGRVVGDGERAAVIRWLRGIAGPGSGSGSGSDAGSRSGTETGTETGTGSRSDWRGFASVWCAGELASRAAIASRGGRLFLDGDLRSANEACRIKVDVIVARAPIATTAEPLFALAIIPGVDGIGVEFGGRETILLPDDLLHADLLAGYRPIPGVDFDTGLDGRGALRLLALRAGVDAATWRRTPHRLFRVRVESFVEAPLVDGKRAAPLAVVRASTVGPEPSAEALRRAAADAGDYLVRHLHDDGRFDYEYYTLSDQRSGDDYSWPRHAGATAFLAQLHGATGDGRYRDAARRALAYLASAHPPGCDRPDRACVGDEAAERVDLGSSALALVAAAEYQRATGDAAFAPWARRLAAFLVSQQETNGDFCHIVSPSENRCDGRHLMYFTGEAALALARWNALEPDPRWPAAVDRALDFLTGENYRYFAGQFFFGEDHWTCLAADAAWDLDSLPANSRARYAEFCEGFAEFTGRLQFHAGDAAARDQPDLAGAYAFSPLAPPHPTPVGSRVEALLSAERLATARGHAARAAAFRAQLVEAYRFLLGKQLRPENSWLVANPESARGGFLMSDVKRTVRIDFLQHIGSGLSRGQRLFAH